MQNNDYLFPSIAAIALAVIFPIYWFNEFSFSTSNMEAALMENLSTLDFSDAVFLFIGLLSIYVYIGLRKILNDQLNFKSIDLLLILVVGAHVIHIATLGLDLSAITMSQQGLQEKRDVFLSIGLASLIGGSILFGLLDILIGAVLLKNADRLPTLLKIFALITLIQGVAGVSVIFSFITLLSFPVSLIILAAYFLRKPDSLEVV